MELKGYYLPKIFHGLEEKLDKKEIKVNGYKVSIPRVNRGFMRTVSLKLKEISTQIHSRYDVEDIANVVGKVKDKWVDENYDKRIISLELLPKLTGLTKELIIFYQFGTIKKMDTAAVRFLSKLEFDKKILDKFVYLDEANIWLKSFTSSLGKLKVRGIMRKLRDIKLVTYITPSNVPGLIEALTIFLGMVQRAGTIIKTPSKQPIFGPLFAESVREVDEEIAESFAVLPWKGGDPKIEDVLFENSDAVSVIGSTESTESVKLKIENLNNEGKFTKGCYHGGKFGLNVISKELAIEEVAALSVIDGIGYEGYMCSSPAFGFFVEEGGPLSPYEFAEKMHEYAEKIGKIIPQGEIFKRYRMQTLSKYISLESTEKIKVLVSSDNNAVVYSEKIELVPDGQNRLFKVYPVKDIKAIIRGLGKWRDYLQTIGIAIPNEQVFKFAEKTGKLGVSNLRVAGTVTLPRLGEAWDGYYPVLECAIKEDIIHWVSINAGDVEEEILKIYKKFKDLENGKLDAW